MTLFNTTHSMNVVSVNPSTNSHPKLQMNSNNLNSFCSSSQSNSVSKPFVREYCTASESWAWGAKNCCNKECYGISLGWKCKCK